MGVLRVVSQSKRHLCVGRWCEERESVVNKILSALRLDQLSLKKKSPAARSVENVSLPKQLY